MNNLLNKLMFFPEKSLFDGMCCGRLALEKAGVPVKKYYASEIKKVAIQNTMRNYPDVIWLENVENIWMV